MLLQSLCLHAVILPDLCWGLFWSRAMFGSLKCYHCLPMNHTNPSLPILLEIAFEVILPASHEVTLTTAPPTIHKASQYSKFHPWDKHNAVGHPANSSWWIFVGQANNLNMRIVRKQTRVLQVEVHLSAWRNFAAGPGLGLENQQQLQVTMLHAVFYISSTCSPDLGWPCTRQVGKFFHTKHCVLCLKSIWQATLEGWLAYSVVVKLLEA